MNPEHEPQEPVDDVQPQPSVGTLEDQAEMDLRLRVAELEHSRQGFATGVLLLMIGSIALSIVAIVVARKAVKA